VFLASDAALLIIARVLAGAARRTPAEAVALSSCAVALVVIARELIAAASRPPASRGVSAAAETTAAPKESPEAALARFSSFLFLFCLALRAFFFLFDGRPSGGGTGARITLG
jgi:hypothetical protein